MAAFYLCANLPLATDASLSSGCVLGRYSLPENQAHREVIVPPMISLPGFLGLMCSMIFLDTLLWRR